MNSAHIKAVWMARNREFIRDRASLAWNIVFPVLMVTGLAILFSGERVELYKVGVFGQASENAAANNFFDTQYIDFIDATDLDAAISKVERHQLDMLFDLNSQRYWINDSSPKGYILEKILAGSDSGSPLFNKETVSGEQVRYVDWVVPGVLAVNMMFSALFGVGYVIVRYRRAGVLRRLKATPLKPIEFLTAQVLSRLWLMVTIGVAVFIGTDYFIDFTMRGSYLDLFIIFVFGATSLISLGLVMASRTSSQELTGGLLNMLSWPMMMLSEAWFSLEGAPQWVHATAQIFPLTHLLDGARAIMIDGASLLDISLHLFILAAMTMLFLALGAALFRWE